jgi:hypothetical protein
MILQGIACTASFCMGLTTAEGQKRGCLKSTAINIFTATVKIKLTYYVAYSCGYLISPKQSLCCIHLLAHSAKCDIEIKQDLAGHCMHCIILQGFNNSRRPKKEAALNEQRLIFL